MRIAIGEVAGPSICLRHVPRRSYGAHLHDDHHRLGDQRPVAREPAQSVANVQMAYCRVFHWPAPNWNAPSVLARVHIDGDYASEWRPKQRQPAWSRQIAKIRRYSHRWLRLAKAGEQ